MSIDIDDIDFDDLDIDVDVPVEKVKRERPKKPDPEPVQQQNGDLDFSELDNFAADLDVSKAKADLEKAKNPFSSLEPGEYTFEILSVTRHIKESTGSSATTDPTWHTFKVEMSCSAGTVNHFLMVPTRSPYFLTASGKTLMFAFEKLAAFLIGVGIPIDIDPSKKHGYPIIVKKCFSNEGKALKGRKLDAVVGFDGAHTKRVDSGYIIYRDAAETKAIEDSEGSEKVFPDIDNAKLAATKAGIKDLQGFPSITKIFPKKG